MSDFDRIISEHCIRLYSLSVFTIDDCNKGIVLNRRFLGKLNLEATWMEETLDAAGARKNERWFPFREGVSAIKLFSSVAYDVLHVKNSFPYYNLIKRENNFEDDVEIVLDELYAGLKKATDYVIKRAKNCGLHRDGMLIDGSEFSDIVVSAVLDEDRKLRHIENPGKSLIYLSTEFMNLKSEITIFNKLTTLEKDEYKNYIPDCVSEETLRLVLVRFHNLQSLYDTYLSESDIESVDKRLKILRGHISFIYHMLKSATDFSHYYERHILPRKTSIFFKSLLPVKEDRFLEITIGFFMNYFLEYFNGATELCKDVINSYAEIGEMDVPIPAYRGFHVRPSTLVSKIINYYGGQVKMVMNGVEYNPSTPLELFRVNEEINAIKRVKLFEMVHKDKLDQMELCELLKVLEKKDEVVIYNSDPEYRAISAGETHQEYLKGAFAYLLASGKIDIKMNITVKFIGDKRSLDDIKLLSESGYGEDKFGNNISLPKKLSYLKS